MTKVRNIIWLFSGIFLIYALCLLVLYTFEEKIIFQPQGLNSQHVFEFDYPFEEFFLECPNGERINALHFKTKTEARGVVLYLHGNADNLQRWGQYHDDFTKRGYDVLFIDYQGYGKSSGIVSEKGLYQNAETAYDWLTRHYRPEQILIYGRSMGTAPASYLATQVASNMLILETPFNNIRGTIEGRFPFFYIPFELRNRLPNDEHLTQLTCPVYIFQGTQDWIVPYQSASQLKPLLKSRDRFYTVEGGGHKNLSSFPSYQEWLDEVLGKSVL